MTGPFRHRLKCVLRISILLLLGESIPAHAQLNYVSNNGTITISASSCLGGTVTIPSTINGLPVTTIGANAFQGCSSITSVIIPNSVTYIGLYAFEGCASLGTVTIGTGVTNIIPDAFYYCNNLTNILVDALNPYYSSVNGVLFDKDQSTLVEFPGGLNGAYLIPSTVIKIGQQAFDGCNVASHSTAKASKAAKTFLRQI